jgi:predicted nucleic acid-binding protein
MAVKVVDASALAALLFGEPEAEGIAELLRGSRLMAPALLDFEIANVCLTKIRRHASQREALLQAFELRAKMPIATIAVDHTRVIALAEANRLTTYDASYLWLARQLGAELVTLDRQLAAAANRT